jgi:hypothetical protein
MVQELTAEESQIQRLLQSKPFRTSHVHRELLLYLADKSQTGTADSLKEYTVGLDVFAKPESYDPRQDSSVRMHCARLRQKLADYYRTEGFNDPVVVDLPKGGFKLTFEPRREQLPLPEALDSPIIDIPPEIKTGTGLTSREIALAALLIVAGALAVYFGARNREERQEVRNVSPAALTPELQQLWEPLLSSSRPLVVCLPTTLFAYIPDVGYARDTSSKDWDEMSTSGPVNALRKMSRSSNALPSYGFTDVGTANGAFQLGKFLAGRVSNVLVTSSDLVSLPEIAMDNVIFLGIPGGNRQVDAIPVERQFSLEPSGIRILHPKPGEPSFIADRARREVEEAAESHALITHVPGLNGAGDVLYLSGNDNASTLAAIQAFTDPAVARDIVSRVKAANGGRLPRFYQLILTVRSMDDMPVDISYTLDREIVPSRSRTESVPH